MAIKRISCPSCHFNQFKHDDGGNLICQACGTRFASPRDEIICDTCGTANPGSALKCMKCGLDLGSTCPVCAYQNAPGLDFCLECGTQLDTFSNVSVRVGEGLSIAKATMEDRLVQSKRDDAVFLHRERERINEAERLRIEQIRAMRKKQLQQQRLAALLAGGAIAITMLGLAVFWLLLQ